MEAWRSEENVGVFYTSQVDGVVSNPRRKLKAISRMSMFPGQYIRLNGEELRSEQ